RAITGACNLAFLFLVVSGFFLWWPRTWTWGHFKNLLSFRRGLTPKARDFNWHHVIGFWSALPLAVVVFSGVVMSYGWANDLVYRAMGEAPPAPASPRSGGPASGASRPAIATPLQWTEGGTSMGLSADDLFARAKAFDPEWRVLTLRLSPPGAPVTFTID